jgi:RHS repeat-associated protein
MKYTKWMRFISAILILTLALNLAPEGAFAIELDEYENSWSDSDYAAGEDFNDDVVDVYDFASSPPPRSYAELKTLSGVVLDADGTFLSAAITEDNQLTTEEINLLASGGVSSEAPAYIMSLDNYFELGLTEDDVEQGIYLHGGENTFSNEISAFTVSVAEGNFDEAVKQDVLTLICHGYTCGEAFGAYASSSLLNMSVDELASARKTEIENNAQTAAADNEEYLRLSINMGVSYTVVEDFMQDYDGDADDLLEEISAAKDELTPSAQSTLGKSSVSGSSSAGFGAFGTQSISAASMSGGSGAYIVENEPTKPHSYDSLGEFDVDINNGTYRYTETDLSITGVNGLDLNITRMFDSQYANSLRISGFNPWTGSYAPEFCVILQYMWLIESSDSDGLTEYIDVRNENYTFLGSVWDFLEDPYLSVPFTADEYYEAAAIKATIEENFFPVAGATNPYGEIVSVYLVPTLIGIYPAFDSYLYNGVETANYSYSVDEYGLGNGWRLGFSAIESYQAGYIDNPVNGKMLITADGRRYEISGSIGTDTSAQKSNLVDYDLLDMRIFKSGNGYTNAVYSLFHKDGKIEYFNAEGRNIAVVDRFGNAITLAYTYKDTTKKVVTRIDITDTLGNVIVYQKQNPNSNTLYTKTGVRNGVNYSTAYNAKWTLTLNGVNVRTYYALDHRYVSPAKTYCVLSAVENEAGETTWIDMSSRSYKYNMFTASVSTSCGVLPVNSIDRICYPGGLTILRTVDGAYTKKASLSAAGFVEYDGRIQFDHLSGSGAVVSVGTSSSSHIYTIGNYSGFAADNYGHYYYGIVTECKLPYIGGANYAVETSKRISEFSSLTHLKSKEEVRTYSPVDEFSLTSKSSLPSPPYTVNSASYEAYTYNANKLPTQIATSLYNPGSSSVAMSYTRNFTYDNKGNVLTEKYPNGQTATYTYDSTYNLPLTKTYSQDASTSIVQTNALSSDKKSVLTATTSRNSAIVGKTGYTYNNKGQVVNRKDYPVPSDSTKYTEQVLSYSSSYANPIEVKTPDVRDADNALVAGSPTFAAGTLAAKTTYNARGLPTSTTDPNGSVSSIQYDAAGRVIGVTNPDGSSLQYSYNISGNAITLTNELGHSFKYTYDKAGNQAGITDVTSGQVKLARKYDGFNKLYQETEYFGNGQSKNTFYLYDNLGRIIDISIKNGSTVLYRETYAYLYTGNQLRITKTVVGDGNAPSVVTTEYRDVMDNVVKAGRVNGGSEYSTVYTYDYLGNKLTEKTAFASGKGVSYSGKWEYDHAGNITKAYNADGGSVTAAYDALGNKTSETDFAGTASTYTYDTLGRIIKESHPIDTSSASVSKYYYDGVGNITSRQISNNATGAAQSFARANYDYDTRGNLIYAISYDGSAVDSVTAYTYDAVGNMLTSQPGMSSKTTGGNITTYTYDRFGNVLTMTDPLGQTESFGYSGLGVLTSKTDRNGNATAYAYDAMGRVLTESVTPSGGTAEAIGYQYALTGAVKQISGYGMTLTYTYDTFGRTTGVSETGSVTKTYAYDIGDNRTGFSASKSGTAIQSAAYTYDNQSRLSTVKDGGATVATYAYDSNGNRASLTYGNGTSEVYSFNKANLVTSVTNKKGSATLSSFGYTYFTDGNQRSKTDGAGKVTTYAYDGAGRLLGESETGGDSPVSVAYEYDKSGNRTSMSVSDGGDYDVSYNYDANNRLLSETKTQGQTDTITTYGYDPNGNTISRIRETLTDPWDSSPLFTLDTQSGDIYGYNGRNQLTSASLGGVSTTYTYRPDGLRAGKTTVEETTEHIWDGANIAADVTNGAATKYVRGVNLILSNAGGATRYYMYNAHGDVVQLTDSSGNAVKAYDYDAFGVERNAAGSDVNPFRYCGEYFDSEANTYYLRARNYTPDTGRMITEDPIRAGLNWYTYCENNPIAFVDPWGLEKIVVSGGAFHYTENKGDKYQYEFLDSALLQISKLSGGATLLVASAGWSTTQYDAIVQAAADRNINLVWFNDIKELTSYINTGGINGNGNRANDPITAFYVFAHGTDSGTGNYAIELGLYAPDASNFSWTTEAISEIDGGVFSKSIVSYFYSCRTGNTFSGNGNFAKTWADKTNGSTYAYRGLFTSVGRSDYSKILGTRLARNGVFPSAAFIAWQTARGDVTKGPGEAWSLPQASYLTTMSLFGKTIPPQPGPVR